MVYCGTGIQSEYDMDASTSYETPSFVFVFLCILVFMSAVLEYGTRALGE